jgi:glycosyltransferase involved in cell wall biosynthesis
VKIELFVRNYGRMIGLARYTQSLCDALGANGVNFRLVYPGYPTFVSGAHPVFARFGWDIKTFFSTYPFAASFSREALKHLTTQQMAILLRRYPNLRPCVVTVHDIVPHLVRKDNEQNTFRHSFDGFFDRLAMGALRNADAIITVSKFTGTTLIENLKIDPERIYTVYEGVDQKRFKPEAVPAGFWQQYSIPEKAKIILYVGSDNPRKNLPNLIRAFARINPRRNDIVLVRVGPTEYPVGDVQIRSLIQEFELGDRVLWLGRIPDETLVNFYNAADLFCFPSLYEGFGLPVLEAMACGTPVVTSNSTSLQEVAGDAALLVDPYDIEAIGTAMRRVLDDPELAAELRARGLKRAAEFTWERTARETVVVYEKVLGKSLS